MIEPTPNPKVTHKKSGVSASRNTDSRTTKLVGINKKKHGGLTGGK